MLQLFRDHTKLIVWISAAIFILCGGYSISALKKEERFAGEVFGKSVTFQEYNQFYRATQLFMPSEKPLEDPEVLRTYTWQNIIYSREAKREGVKVTDQEVRDEIAKILQQQGLVNPTPQQYNVWLTRALHMSPREFEEGLREFIRIQKLLRVKVAGLIPAGSAEKPQGEKADEKANEAAEQAKKEAFMKWTIALYQKAALKDYLAIPGTPSEQPETKPEQPPEPPPAADPKK